MRILGLSPALAELTVTRTGPVGKSEGIETVSKWSDLISVSIVRLFTIAAPLMTLYGKAKVFATVEADPGD